jgi:CheY-like chemotaxis protein
MMEMRMPKDDPNITYLKEILAAAERATQLTQALLIFSRKQSAVMKPIHINVLIEGIRKMMLRLIGEDIEIVISLAPENMMIMGDHGQLEQVLMNFVTNARDAMPDGGSLSIETRLHVIDSGFIHMHGFGKPGKYAVISVSDTGEGMDEKTRDRIFEPFFTTKGVGKGTGLGLSIVYGIVKQHHGYINCYSEPGRGTTFKVYLPIVREELLELEEADKREIIGGNETILVADDDESIRRLTKELLEHFGYTVIDAADGEEAVIKFIDHRERIDLVILDVIMPRKSGREAFEEIRAMRPDVKALFISGYTEDIVQRKRIIEDELPLLQKPARPKELLARVREILDAKSD